MKKLLTSLVLTFCLLMVTAQSVQAQEPSAWDRFTGGITNLVQRVYLMLPGEKSGLAVLNQTMSAMQDVKTARTESVVQVTADTAQTPFTGAWTTQGVIEAEDLYDLTTFRQQMTFEGSIQSQNLSLPVSGEIVQDGQTGYVMFTELPMVPFFNTARAKGIWIRVGQSTVTPELNDEERQQLRAASEELLRSATVSTARKEDLDGTPVFVIDVTFDEEDVTTYSTRVSEILNDGGHMTEIQEPLTVTLFIDRNSYYLRRLVAPLSFTTQSLGEVMVNADVRWTDYNQPVVIDVPEAFQDVSQVMQEVMPGDAERTIDLEELQVILEGEESDLPAELEGLSEQERQLLREMGIEL
ncbi:MAG TPA: hypothetical protein VF209_01730 [Patescibacteria group bacterium]